MERTIMPDAGFPAKKIDIKEKPFSKMKDFIEPDQIDYSGNVFLYEDAFPEDERINYVQYGCRYPTDKWPTWLFWKELFFKAKDADPLSEIVEWKLSDAEKEEVKTIVKRQGYKNIK